MPTVRLERDGLFGRVGVVDTADARRFTIGGVLQGASLLRPSAADVDPTLPPGPGPVIETRYQLGWFLPGQRHPSGRTLMLGLGGGCGAVGLLHEFPDLALDAVDADPAMVRMAREFHPLIPYYERQGRLRLTVADAVAHLGRSAGRYDYAIADLVVNADLTDPVDSVPLVQGLADVSGEIWFRVFGSLPDAEIEPILRKFTSAGAPADWLYSPISHSVPIPRTRDWIVAAGVRHVPDPDAYRPFASLRGPRVESVRQAYRKLASDPLPARGALA